MPKLRTSSAARHKLALAAGLLLLLGACAAPKPAQRAPEQSAPPPAAAPAPALGGRLLADAQEYPWSALARVNLAGQGFCTGVLIGPRQVLTQARCLYSGREGRWFQPLELHVIAAYQRDSFLADSKVAGFTAAPGFNPQAGSSLTNLASNWALVTLQEPIGQRTGWLGLEWDGPALQGATRLRAGYRQDRPHAVSLHFGCAETVGAVDLCQPTPSEIALPSFAVVDGQLRVLADFYAATLSQGRPLARLTGSAISERRLGSARPPAGGSPVGRQPMATAEKLLAALGYDPGGGRLAEAAAAFRRDSGLMPADGVDMALLAALIAAAQHGDR
jgi:hypothetical protein